MTVGLVDGSPRRASTCLGCLASSVVLKLDGRDLDAPYHDHDSWGLGSSRPGLSLRKEAKATQGTYHASHGRDDGQGQ